jgi:hypothetical protein
MTERVTNEYRACPRVAVALDVQLGRKVGNDVIARTRDLSVGGARVVSGRPLRIDEELQFDLDLPAGGQHVCGTARVLRQHRHDLYALRFENVAPAVAGVLGAFVDANSG